jgi:hypothetical protein
MKQWFKALNSTWQALTVIGSVILFSLAVGGWYNTLSGLPEEIELNRQSIAEIQSRVGNVEKGQDAILSAIRLSNCLALAQAKDEPYQECMK